MPPTPPSEQIKLDPRIYIAILFFRWKLIMVCLLYCLLGAVIYLEFVPKQYSTQCSVMSYRDPSLAITSSQADQWRSFSMQDYLFRSGKLSDRVVERLRKDWSGEVGDSLALPVSVSVVPHMSMMYIRVRSPHPRYGTAFLSTLLDEFQKEHTAVKRQSYESATTVLTEEIERLDERIRAAEDDVIEYERLNQMTYASFKGSLERGYLSGLMARRSGLSTEIMMLEAQFPKLKGEDVFVIHDVDRLTRETGALRAPDEGSTAATSEEELSEAKPQEKEPGQLERDLDELNTWQDTRVQLRRLQLHEKELLQNLRPEHPEVQATRKKIADLQADLDFAAEVAFDRLKGRRKALTIQLEALGAAERRWQDSYLLLSKKQTDLSHLRSVVSRLEGMYQTLYSRLHNLLIDEEIKSEHWVVMSPPLTGSKPVWPDPLKILFMALLGGLGSGVGLALLTHVLDNKVQSIADVELEIGVPFLGGIPFWVHSDLGHRIRAIVSEEHSTGAAEAYRALRTNVLSALEKAGQNLLLVTSAESQEGKTLTVLNLALMSARTGRKVLLLDMDLRRGVLHKSLDMERSPGITDVLTEGRPLRDVIVKTSYDNLWFAPAGTTVKNTAELLQSVDLRAFLAEARQEFGLVLMDSAPVLRVTDTVILADPQLCAVVYVAHANKTPKPMIRYSIEMLEDANVIGMIVNSLEMHRISSLYYAYQYPNYAYYSYAYAYGYDYYYLDDGTRPKRLRAYYHAWAARRRAFGRWLRRTFLPME